MPRKRTSAFESLHADFLVLGSGIAGLWSALQLAEHGDVLVVTKKDEAESNTNYAQGGIAAVMSQFDSINAHVKDTLTVGSGLAKPTVVRRVIASAPEMVGKLIDVGVHFTYMATEKRSKSLDLGLEGGHSAARVVHAADLTGQEIERALVSAVMAHPRITLLVHHLAIDLIVSGKGRTRKCVGAWVFDRYGRVIKHAAAPVTLLTTGGAGQVYRHTTNPEIATGDGVAMSYRVGCRIANMEFVQFHPTRLFLPGAGRFLISEALRGAGGKLRNSRGEFFMAKVHPLADLAPRDIVARAIVAECRRTKSRCAYLDMTHLKPQFVRERFPNIYKRCHELGLDITRKAIPVIPAAHYMCGGVMTDLQGRTDIPGLWAAGEVACTGLHGANRLASNSLLEAMYFADTGARSAIRALKSLERGMKKHDHATPPPAVGSAGRGRGHWSILRDTMWEDVGIIRDRGGLSRARTRLQHLIKDAEHRYRTFGTNADTLEFRSATLVGWLIAESAFRRRESRGLHERTDFPRADDARFRDDTVLMRRG